MRPNPTIPGEWLQDPADYSWVMIDLDGCIYRIGSVVDGDGPQGFALAWTEGNGVRIGSGLYASADVAKMCVGWIARLPNEAGAAA